MSFFLANPWGLLAVAAIPAIVAIHFLQERSRHVRTSTLFLLEHVRPTSEGGVRVERFRNSLPFWMQILAACALAWLLADPRWIRVQTRQTVVVVLDSSASMQAFRRETLDILAARLRRWEAAAHRTDWHLLETGPRRPPLYAGRSLTELVKAAEDRWQPVLGGHSFADAVTAARALVPGEAGGVILVTDRPTDVPADVALLSVGEPFDNVGFSGGRVDVADGKATWRALATNHGKTATTREMIVRAAGGDGLTNGEPLALPQTLEFAPGQSRSLTAEWPADDRDRIVLTLAADRFGLDDSLPLLRPVQRPLTLVNRLKGAVGESLRSMASLADGVDEAADGGEPDLVIDVIGAEPTASGILVVRDDAGKGDESRQSFDPGWVAAEDHPLVRDLSWGGLLSGPAEDVAIMPADAPLLWKAGRPLAFLRTASSPGGRRVESLVLAWDIANSNATRTAAVVVMLTRFVERVRAQIPRGWSENVETGQAIPLPGGRHARAPETPGFFTVPLSAREGGSRQMMNGAAQFVDARESDLLGAATTDTLDTIRMERIAKRSVEDPWAPLWVAVTAAALLVSWGWRSRS